MTELIDHTLRDRWAPAEPSPLPPYTLRWLRSRIGETTTARPEHVPTPAASALTDRARAALAAVVGDEHVRTAASDRLGRADGLSYVDLVRRRAGGDLAAPDAVVLPADADEVAGVLATCVEHDVAVVPFGGGTSVVGGVRALRGDKHAVIALDLLRLDRLVSVDQDSHLAVLGAGVRAPAAEDLLAAHGFTLGHVPQSWERATVGGFAATRSAGQASSGYGGFAEMVAGVELLAPAGRWRLGVAPSSAAGPDLREVVVGSEGAFGVITEVTLRVRRLAGHRRYEGFVLDSLAAGVEAVRDLAQAGVLADVTRLSDAEETEVSLALAGRARSLALRGYLGFLRRVRRPCLLVLGWESADAVAGAARRRASLRVLRRHSPVRLGTPLGEAWRHGRFNGPRQRDALLDAGVCVETLETATRWANLTGLRDAVRAALHDALAGDGREPIVMCHLSHAYETGASLYFTVLVPRDAGDPVTQWQRAKDAACLAITAHGGTISHHHATGVDHAGYLEQEIGTLGVDVLAGIKNTLDPAGIMNPGKLIPRP